MAHVGGPDSKRELFRRYLEKTGVIDGLTNVLVALHEDPEKPDNALDFIKSRLGGAGAQVAEIQALRRDLMELQQKYDALMEENRVLKNRLFQYEPAHENGGLE